MNSLRIRIAVLAALVALLAVSVSAIAGVRSARRSVREQQARAAVMGLEDVRIQLQQVVETVGHEVQDYAAWDELYEHMPSPPPAWTAINLVPGKGEGGITQVFVLARDGDLIGRYRFGSAPRTGPADGDPAPSAALIALARREPGEGVGLLGGTPVLWAIRPITRSDGTGKPRGTIMGLAYIDHAVLAHFHLHGWTLTFAPEPTGPGDATVSFSDEGGKASASRTEAVLGGGLRITATEQAGEADDIAFHANNAIAIAGMVTALLATLAGIALGLHWVRPIHRLAAACRRRAIDPDHPLPVDRGLAEAEVLGAALNELVDAERRHREELAAALDRETTANAVHLRFLAQLGQEFGEPIRQLSHAVDRLAGNDGRLPPEEVAAARQVAQLLEDRFQEVLGLVAGREAEPGGRERDVGEYLAGVGDLLRPVAQRRGIGLRVEADPGPALIDARLLTPVLVNLAANAIAASTRGEVVLAARQDEAGGTVWTVRDPGCGLPEAVSAALGASDGHGAPATAGLGLGLTLVLANVQALGGRLQLESTGPQGTVLRVHLPAARPRSGVYPYLRTPPRPARYGQQGA